MSSMHTATTQSHVLHTSATLQIVVSGYCKEQEHENYNKATTTLHHQGMNQVSDSNKMSKPPYYNTRLVYIGFDCI